MVVSSDKTIAALRRKTHQLVAEISPLCRLPRSWLRISDFFSHRRYDDDLREARRELRLARIRQGPSKVELSRTKDELGQAQDERCRWRRIAIMLAVGLIVIALCVLALII